MRLIDADALKQQLQSHHDFFVNAWGGFGGMPEKDKARVDEISSCIAEIVNAPTVDAEPVRHGRWDAENRCVVCGHLCPTVTLKDGTRLHFHTPYCPGCGAKMDGGADNGAG